MSILTAKDFRPSSSPRYMVCPGSVTLSAGKPDTPSEYAAAGTRQHRFAEIALSMATLGKADCQEEYEELRKAIGIDAVESVMGYVSWAKSLVQEGDLVLIEQKVDTSEAVGVDGASGSLDFAIIRADRKALLIADRKFPWGKPVYAEGEDGAEDGEGNRMLGHPPLMVYALGVISTFDGVFFEADEIGHIDFAIYQESAGRSDATDTWECTRAYLESFRAMLLNAVRRARNAELRSHLVKDDSDYRYWIGEFLRPTVTACKYCKAKADLTCPAVTGKALQCIAQKEVLIADEIEPQIADWEIKIAELTDAKIEELYDLLPLVTDWVKAVKWQMSFRMLEMKAEMTRYKIVEGRMGNRKWSDDAAVDLAVTGQSGAYSFELLDPPAMERAAKSGKIPKELWEEVQEYVERRPGKPTIARKADEREEVALPMVEEIPNDLLPPIDD